MTRLLLLVGLSLLQGYDAFCPYNKNHIVRTSSTSSSSSLLFSTSPSSSSSNENDQVAALLEKARQIRAEAAALEGRSVEEVEQEAVEKRQRTKQAQEDAAQARKERAVAAKQAKVVDGSFLTVPETADDQVALAKQAVEKAFQDGITRQIVRFALVPEGEYLNQNDRQWPGGASQMYREAAGPMTRELLRVVKTDPERPALVKQPKVQSQDVWDFDGSALVTAEAANGPAHDVQALVQPNTDTKYTKDIQSISQAMKNRLFILVNPFWRDVESWGFNLLAPNAKKLAQEVIYSGEDGGFQETFVLLQKSVRGEDCIALKVYPYDWQLYAYCESDYWPYAQEIIYLGSTPDEPKSSEFGALMEKRDEFKMSKNMRQLQRMTRRDE